MFWHSVNSSRSILILFSVLAVTDQVLADALVVTKAMQASTIAEFFIEHDQIRLEIEVGQQDLAAFKNILPDEVYEKLTGTVRPLAERIKDFLESDWQISTNTETLKGRMTKVAVGRRVIRDEVTGEPLAEQPANAEQVIRIRMTYDFPNEPEWLHIQPPMSDDDVAANIGFVCYHNGLPINDFRYLPGTVTLDLDWDDPWYSKFRNRNLSRQFNAPVSVYIYVEPFEVRKEIIIRPKDLETRLDLDLDGEEVIAVARQEELKQKVAKFLAERSPLTVDGRIAEGKLDRIHFIRRSLRTTGIIEPAVDLDATSATLGVIYVYPIDSLPESVTMRWELFTPKIQAIPAVVSDEAGGLPSEITPDNTVLEWKNYLINPTSPELKEVGITPIQQPIPIPMLSLICGCVVIGSTSLLLKQKWSGRSASKTALITIMSAVLGGIVAFPYARVSVPWPLSSPPQLSKAEGRELLATLLYNTYRSFDHHDQSLIYDRLSHSIDGDLLSQVYLETRKSMEVKNQGGLRVSVKEVDVIDLRLEETSTAGATFECRWRVAGWIGHWGHIHRRVNEHVALLTVAPCDQQWKIIELEMLDKQSLESSRRPNIDAGGGA